MKKKALISGVSGAHAKSIVRVPSTVRLAIAAGALLAVNQIASAAPCDRACLLEHAKLFNAAMLANAPDRIQLAPKTQIRENTKSITLPESKWSDVKQILSEGKFADPIKGNVIEHITGRTAGGKVVYIGTRLKVADGGIVEVEVNCRRQ